MQLTRADTALEDAALEDSALEDSALGDAALDAAMQDEAEGPGGAALDGNDARALAR